MGIIGKIKSFFSGNYDEKEYDGEAESASLSRDKVDMYDKQQREGYVRACLEQMSEASRELDMLGGEYNLVTSYLTDMEEIEAFPEETKEKLKNYANKLVELESDRERLAEKKARMNEADFIRMERIEQYMPEGYKTLKEAEEYHVTVKKDLGRLEGERHACYFRRNELLNSQRNMKGITIICVSSMIFLIIILAIMSFTLKIDATVGYAIAVLIAASELVFVYLKFQESQKELARVDKSVNKLVLLQNSVKIHYVNNTNLLEYLYVKYDVNNSTELKRLWDKYTEELKRREEQRKMEIGMDENQAALVSLLRRNKIRDAAIWLRQVPALLDSKEMVEIRHNYIIRRQKLRKQMEYNSKKAQEAQDEVKDILEKYPEYAEKLLDIIAEYEKALA